jgi:hypothetical protein
LSTFKAKIPPAKPVSTQKSSDTSDLEKTSCAIVSMVRQPRYRLTQEVKITLVKVYRSVNGIANIM